MVYQIGEGGVSKFKNMWKALDNVDVHLGGPAQAPEPNVHFAHVVPDAGVHGLHTPHARCDPGAPAGAHVGDDAADYCGVIWGTYLVRLYWPYYFTNICLIEFHSKTYTYCLQ